MQLSGGLMKISRLALVLLLAIAAPARSAWAQPITQCTQYPAAVEVNLDYTAPQEDTTMTAVQLDASLRDDPNSTLASDRRGIYVGVTKWKFEMSNHFEFSDLFNVRQDAACPFVKRVVYTITYRPAVFIASDFTRMACRYGVTVMHEKRHVDASLQTINEYMPQIRQAAEDYIAHMPPKQPTTQLGIPDRQKEIMKEISESLRPVIGKLMEANRQRQAVIDSPANYARDDATCPGQHPAFPVR
jgi:hypothetical protein